MKRCFLIVLLAVFLVPSLLPQTPSQTEQILKRLDQLEKQNADLLLEIKALRETLVKPNENLSERQDVTEHRVEELAQTKVESSQHFPLQLTGTLLFNSFLNGAYSGGVQDPVAASSTPGSRDSGASFRQTVLGLKFTGPQTFLGGTVSGSMYMDFFGGSADSINHLLRFRVATLQIDWPNTTFTVGQDKPLVSQREPNSLAQVGVSPLTNAGNPWLWRPQARLEQKINLARNTRITAEAGIFETDEDSSPTLKIEAARPAFQTRIGVRQSWGDDRFVEVAPVFHISSSHVSGSSVDSRLWGVDWQLKPAAKYEITGLLFRGENFSNLGALGGFNPSSTGSFIPVHGSGGWAQLRYFATPKLSFNLYAGQQDDRNIDLRSGQIAKNQYYAANSMYLLAPNVIAAFEFGQNRTGYLGSGNRLNNHYDLALAYLF